MRKDRCQRSLTPSHPKPQAVPLLQRNIGFESFERHSFFLYSCSSLHSIQVGNWIGPGIHENKSVFLSALKFSWFWLIWSLLLPMLLFIWSLSYQLKVNFQRLLGVHWLKLSLQAFVHFWSNILLYTIQHNTLSYSMVRYYTVSLHPCVHFWSNILLYAIQPNTLLYSMVRVWH